MRFALKSKRAICEVGFPELSRCGERTSTHGVSRVEDPVEGARGRGAPACIGTSPRKAICRCRSRLRPGCASRVPVHRTKVQITEAILYPKAIRGGMLAAFCGNGV